MKKAVRASPLFSEIHLAFDKSLSNYISKYYPPSTSKVIKIS
jgi:hypothetical protein